MAAVPLYGLDIETDTSTDGLDPSVSAIIAIAVSSDAQGDVAFTGTEAEVITAADAHLAALPTGVIVTWNGAAFDLPFLADRAALCGAAVGLSILWDPRIVKRREAIAGHIGAYRACWHSHAHLDAYRAYRALTDDSELSCGLKAVARREGFDPVEVDATRVHELGADQLRTYVMSDARLARVLAERRWGKVRTFVDRHHASAQLALAYR